MANELETLLEIDTLEEENVDHIRQNISTMSFEDLQKLKQKIGAKLYNKKILNIENTKKNAQRSFKRANKNRPREMSSKTKVKKDVNIIVKSKPQKSRDPRFDPLCGTFDKTIFKKNYRFVGNMKIKEKAALEKQLKSTKDPEEKEKLNYLIRRLTNQIKDEENQSKKEQALSNEKKEILEKVKKGEKPQFKKKSVKKLENLVEKYESLKKSNKLKKHIEKKMKKVKLKEKKPLLD